MMRVAVFKESALTVKANNYLSIDTTTEESMGKRGRVNFNKERGPLPGQWSTLLLAATPLRTPEFALGMICRNGGPTRTNTSALPLVASNTMLLEARNKVIAHAINLRAKTWCLSIKNIIGQTSLFDTRHSKHVHFLGAFVRLQGEVRIKRLSGLRSDLRDEAHLRNSQARHFDRRCRRSRFVSRLVECRPVGHCLLRKS